ncbi:MAG: septum formation protein Maf [Candidatus Dadabacteria bacterium]|nr:MAG: septum formation protein Maf [Candidatus Dadabacteria bacterium]
MADLVLASSSPRRRRLLLEAGFEFTVISPEVDEDFAEGESPRQAVERLAIAKAMAVGRRCPAGKVVLGADTAVVRCGRVYGKPAGAADAERMLLELGGRNHEVLTGWALVASGRPDCRRIASGVACSVVRMREIGRREAAAYVATGEPLDKAGAYAVQGEGARFVVAILGSRTNVIGLPVEDVVPVLASAGVKR